MVLVWSNLDMLFCPRRHQRACECRLRRDGVALGFELDLDYIESRTELVEWIE